MIIFFLRRYITKPVLTEKFILFLLFNAFLVMTKKKKNLSPY